MNKWLLALILVALVAYLYLYAPGRSCNVAYIKLHGYLATYTSQDASTSDQTASEDVTQAIRDADSDSSIRAIVLEVDSGGGSPVAGEEIEKALKASSKPTVALIRSNGDSAAYLSASGASYIFASQFSGVGDIGITSSYTDNAAQNANSGITFNQLSIGKYKDMYNQDKPLTADERALALSQLELYYQDFVDIVAQNRGLATSTVESLADGAERPAAQALHEGLIDQIGGLEDVRAYLQGKLHRTPTFCGLD